MAVRLLLGSEQLFFEPLVPRPKLAPVFGSATEDSATLLAVVDILPAFTTVVTSTGATPLPPQVALPSPTPTKPSTACSKILASPLVPSPA